MKVKNLIMLTAMLLTLKAIAGEDGSAEMSATERTFDRVTDVKRGDRVHLRGEVVRIADEDEFILEDDSGRIRIYIGWKNDLPVDRGDVVIVEGRADDDGIPGFKPEIYARVLELANGERVELVR